MGRRGSWAGTYTYDVVAAPARAGTVTLDAALPSLWIALGVEDGDHDDSAVVEHEVDAIGEAFRKSAADVLIHDGERFRQISQSVELALDFANKVAAKAFTLAVVV